MRYIASEIKKASGVSLLLEKAIIKATNTPLLFAVLIKGESEKEKQLLRDMGAWFQNKAVRDLADRVSKVSHSQNELYSFSERYFDSLSGFLQDHMMKDISLIFCIDDNALIYGDNAFLLQQQFGKPVFVPAHHYENESFKLISGASILITDGDPDMKENRDIPECLMTADTEESLNRAVREVAQVYPSSLICIKIC